MRNVGFAVNHGTGGEQEIDEGGVGCGGVEGEGGDADGGVEARDVEAVFYADGKTVEGPEGCAGAMEVGV